MGLVAVVFNYMTLYFDGVRVGYDRLPFPVGLVPYLIVSLRQGVVDALRLGRRFP